MIALRFALIHYLALKFDLLFMRSLKIIIKIKNIKELESYLMKTKVDMKRLLFKIPFASLRL